MGEDLNRSLIELLKELHPFMTCEGGGATCDGKVVFRFNTLKNAQKFHSFIIAMGDASTRKDEKGQRPADTTSPTKCETEMDRVERSLNKPLGVPSEISLFKLGEFTSHSGLRLSDKINCDALTRSDWKAQAKWFSDRIGFGKVVGIPSGGLKFAEALEEYCSPFGPVLIVDDVLTTGRSMEEARLQYPDALGAVLFSRTPNIPSWITARFTEAKPEPVMSKWHTEDGRPIFGEDSPHNISEHLDSLTKEQPVEITSLISRLRKLAWECRRGEPISRDEIGTLCADVERGLNHAG